MNICLKKIQNSYPQKALPVKLFIENKNDGLTADQKRITYYRLQRKGQGHIERGKCMAGEIYLLKGKKSISTLSAA